MKHHFTIILIKRCNEENYTVDVIAFYVSLIEASTPTQIKKSN